jgi:hypothetical protein
LDPLFKQIERAKQEWETTVDVIDEGVSLFDNSSMEILRANWTLARYYKTKPQDLVGFNIHSLLCNCKNKNCRIKSILESPRADTLEFKQEGKDKFWRMNIYPIPDLTSGSSRSVIVLRDVTQEKLWHERIIAAEQKVANVRTLASLANDISPSMNYIKHNLYSIANHLSKLRSAFNDYRISLSALNAQNDEKDQHNWQSIESEHSVEFRLLDIEQSVRQSMRDLNQISHAFENLKYMEYTPIQMQYSDLKPILREIIDHIQNENKKKTNYENPGNLPLVRCDPSRLQTALTEVINSFIASVKKDDEIFIKTRMKDENIEIRIGREHLDTEGKPTTEELIDQSNTVYSSLQAETNPIFGIIQEHGGELKFDDTNHTDFFVTISLPVHGPISQNEQYATL